MLPDGSVLAACNNAIIRVIDGAAMWTAGGLLLAFIVLPIVRLAATSPPASLRQAAATAAIRDATLLSLQAAAITAVIATVFGVRWPGCWPAARSAAAAWSRPWSTCPWWCRIR